jgi:hypothetical protein
MKRILFGSTALVTAGVLASSVAQAEEGIKLGLGGYMNNFFVAGDVSDSGNDFNETGFYSDGEVWFTGETTLDNGLTFGANVQLESFASGDQIDENYGYMEGGFGRLVFGSENTAAYLMHYAAPSVGAPVNSGWVTSFVPAPSGSVQSFRSPAVSTYLDTGNDENTLTYFTPRLYGFQLGVSYQAAVNFSGDGKNFPVEADEDTEYHDGVGIGLNFVESFGGFDVALSGGYRYASAPNNSFTVIFPNNTATTNGPGTKVLSIKQNDIQQVSGGLNLGYAGFTFGGSIAAELDGRKTVSTSAFNSTVTGFPAAALPSPYPANTFITAVNSYNSDVTSTEGWSYDIGASYGTGPWSFGITYFYGEVEGSVLNGDNDQMQAINGGIEYAVGPGISASGGVMYADWDDEAGADNSGFVGYAGLHFGF